MWLLHCTSLYFCVEMLRLSWLLICKWKWYLQFEIVLNRRTKSFVQLKVNPNLAKFSILKIMAKNLTKKITPVKTCPLSPHTHCFLSLYKTVNRLTDELLSCTCSAWQWWQLWKCAKFHLQTSDYIRSFVSTLCHLQISSTSWLVLGNWHGFVSGKAITLIHMQAP